MSNVSFHSNRSCSLWLRRRFSFIPPASDNNAGIPRVAVTTANTTIGAICTFCCDSMEQHCSGDDQQCNDNHGPHVDEDYNFKQGHK